MKKELIVIPAYQPLESLVPLTEEIFKYFENVLVIDDGGRAEYAHIFKKLEEMGAIIVTHAINQGKGRALKSAVNYCLLHPELWMQMDSIGQQILCVLQNVWRHILRMWY